MPTGVYKRTKEMNLKRMKKHWESRRKNGTDKASKKTIETLSKSHMGIKHSEATKKKIGDFTRGKNYEERYGVEIAKIVKEKLSKNRKGKSYIESYGAEKAKKIGKKLSIANIKRFSNGDFPQTNTLPHRLLREAMQSTYLWEGFQDEYPYILGNEKGYAIDIANPEKKIAIFIDGEYWHANPEIYKSSDVIMNGKLAKDLWKKDKKQTTFLKNRGWTVLRFWEAKIKKDICSCLKEIIKGMLV